MDYHTIAEVLEINYQSVRNVASAGLKALRKLIGLLFLLWWL
jgi:RNA polymerase sigma-70 factor (ECF subfamily)